MSTTLFITVLFFSSDPVLAHVSFRSPAPLRVDAFSGVLDRPSLIGVNRGPITGVADLNVAVVLSENTKKQIEWSNDMMAGLSGFDRAVGGFIAGSAAVAESDRANQLAYDPKFITDSVMQPLVSRFHSVRLIGGMEQFTGGNYDLVVLLDVSFINTFHDSWVLVGNKYETGTTVNAYFMDRRNTQVGRVEVSQKRPVPRAAFQKGVVDLRSEVLSQYRSALAALLGPERRPVAVTAPAAPAAPASSSISDRLRALEELRRNGLITEQEAALKRADILKGM
jgi:hypothetical protein